MGNFPTSPRSAVYSFAEVHAPIWSTQGTAVGLNSQQTTGFTEAVAAYAQLQRQADAAKFALENINRETATAYNAMRRELGLLTRTITAFALDQSDPAKIFALAQIPGPQAPGTAPPPAQPTNLNASIIASSGKIQLTWKASNPRGTAGTSYIVRRKLPGETTFSFVGVTGSKKFVDGTFLAGPDFVQYTVQGQRSDAAGPESQVFTLNFGVPGGGGVQIEAKPEAATGPKLAA